MRGARPKESKTPEEGYPNEGVLRDAGRHLRLRGVVYAVFVISLLLTLLVYFYASQSLEAQTGVRFREASQTARATLERRNDAYVDALFGARAYLVASGDASAKGWEDYIESLRLEDRYSSFQALGYIRYETVGGPGGEVRTPVDLIGPRDRANELLEGRDYSLEPAQREAIERARDSGEARATGRVYVLSETRKGAKGDLALRPGFFVYLPVYRDGEPLRTRDERRAAVEGYVFGSFKMDELLGKVFPKGTNPGLDFEVYDGERLTQTNLLYDEDGVLRALEDSYSPRYSSNTEVEVAGREWTLYLASLPGFTGATERTLPVILLISGVAASLALAIFTWLLAGSRERSERTGRALEESNRELEAFSYSVSHDLRAPLRSIAGFSEVLIEDYSTELDGMGVTYLERLRRASVRMSELIDDLLQLSRVGRAPLNRSEVDLSEQAREISTYLEDLEEDLKEGLEDSEIGPKTHEVEWRILETPNASGDARLLRVVMENLLGNAWKFTARESRARIEFGAMMEGRYPVYYVRDDGAGFDMEYAGKLFGAFQRLHTEDEFEGTGIGLATVARIVHRHGGEVWAEGAAGEGATFYFTLEGNDPDDRPKG